MDNPITLYIKLNTSDIQIPTELKITLIFYNVFLIVILLLSIIFLFILKGLRFYY